MNENSPIWARDAATVKPVTLVISCAGGHFAHGLALGAWLHRQPLHLHVPAYCNSACANYVFTAAKSRELGDYAVVAFHGGMTDTADRRAQLQVQLAPGSPATAQARLERYLRDAKLLDIGAGTNEIRRMLIGRELIGAR